MTSVTFRMKFLVAILFMFSSIASFGQTILDSPEQASEVENIDYSNIKWADWQDPYYYTGHPEKILKQDMYLEAEAEEAEEVLFEKINLYREVMGKERLVLNDTGSLVCRKYARQLAKTGKFTHRLNGKTPTDRMRPYFPYRIEATENLNQIGSTLFEENMSVDEFTDITLHCWINSKGHNTNLLKDGEVGAVGIYTKIDKKKNEQSTIAVFSILYRR